MTEVALFVGGPLDGQLHEVRKRQWTVMAHESSPCPMFGDDSPMLDSVVGRKVCYERQVIALFGNTMLIYAPEDLPRRGDIGPAVLNAILTPRAKAALRP